MAVGFRSGFVVGSVETLGITWSLRPPDWYRPSHPFLAKPTGFLAEVMDHKLCWRTEKAPLFGSAAANCRASLRFTRNDRERGWKNGETGRVVEVDETNRSVVVETEPVKGQVARHGLDLRQDRHWEHGYASTIFSAQGRTTDEVVIHRPAVRVLS